ncbi:hypothetical protein Tco_0008559 [Tanacetum coccineum]
MAQQQHAADVHPDELCPPNKRYDLMDANKKVDFEQVQCPPESKILNDNYENHPLREDGSKYRLRFMLDEKELSLTLDDFKIIFHLPHATNNNHDSFVPPPSCLDMVPFYKNDWDLHGAEDIISFKKTVSYNHGNVCVLETGTHRTPSAPRRSTRLTLPAPVELVNEQLASVEIKKMVEGPENVIDDSSIPRNDDQNIYDTRLEPRSDKESPEVEITNDEERREKGKIVEESRSIPFPTPIRSPRIHTDLELQGRYGYLFKHLKARFLSRKSFDTLADHLQEVMVESLPTMVDKHIKEQVKTQVPEQVKV